MDDPDKSRRVYDEKLAKNPFPSVECGQAPITGKLHGALILYLADIAGLASRGEQGQAAVSDQEKRRFRELAWRASPNRCRK
jgi:hypothetical protein